MMELELGVDTPGSLLCNIFTVLGPLKRRLRSKQARRRAHLITILRITAIQPSHNGNGAQNCVLPDINGKQPEVDMVFTAAI